MGVFSFRPRRGGGSRFQPLSTTEGNFLPLDGSKPMTGPIDMGSHQIQNLALPTGPLDAVNEEFVTATFARLDGSVPMTGNLDLGRNLVTNMIYPVNILDATNKSYVDSQIAGCLKRDGTDPAEGNLNMAGYAIEDLKDADNSTPSENAVKKNMWTRVCKPNSTRSRKKT